MHLPVRAVVSIAPTWREWCQIYRERQRRDRGCLLLAPTRRLLLCQLPFREHWCLGMADVMPDKSHHQEYDHGGSQTCAGYTKPTEKQRHAPQPRVFLKAG